MMRAMGYIMAAGASVLALAVSGGAQAQDAASGVSEADLAAGQDIIVTARRKNESLLDVPESVAVVSSEQVEKYNVLKMLDVQKLVPGLNLSDGNGFQQNTSMRGITFTQTQALPQTVAFYINDVLARPQHAYQAFFDVGQIEVLRGPQGTLRGEISPSGAITVTTRRPDLEEFGGYVSGSLGTLDNYNIQGAVGGPIIPGKLAIRIAAVRDKNSQNGVRSVFNSVEPYQKSQAVRATVLFQPTEDLRAVVTYQHLVKDDVLFSGAVFGEGSPGVPGNPNAPAGFNGPVIGLRDRLSVAAGPEVNKLKGDLVQAQVDWTFAGQRLSYIGGFAGFSSRSLSCAEVDNTAPFPCFAQLNTSRERSWSHEVRLSSEERLFDKLDYTLGVFHANQRVPTRNIIPPNFLAGAFGAPGTPAVPGTPNYRYSLGGVLDSTPAETIETAVFGSLTYHLDENTELTGGLRWTSFKRTFDQDLTYSSAFNALAVPAGTCAFIGGVFGATYPNICDLPVVRAPFHAEDRTKENPIIYNVQLSHKFSPDLMVYGRVANSFRAGAPGLPLLIQTQNPQLSQYFTSRPEKSTSYEVGLKGSLFNRGLQFEVNYFHQTFEDYLYYTLPTRILVSEGTPRVSLVNLTANAPAVVDGVELSLSGKVTRDFSLTGNLAWTNGRLDNATVPCNSPDFTTVQQFQTAGQSVALCESGAATSVAPKLTFSVQGEYQRPVTDNINGFVRALASYTGRNPNANNDYVIPAYSIVDLHLGIRAPDGQWEIDGYAKNLLKAQTLLRRGVTDGEWGSGLNAFFGARPGYTSVGLVARREFGVTLRYAFGSR